MTIGFKEKNIRPLRIRGPNWVGDSVMVIPALREIRKVFPTTIITALVLPWVRDIYKISPWVDEVLIYDRDGKHAGISRRLRLVRTIAKRKFDAALLLQNAFEAALLARLARIPIRAGYKRDGRGWLLTHGVLVDQSITKLHQIFYYWDLVDQLFRKKRIGLEISKNPVKIQKIYNNSLPLKNDLLKTGHQILHNEGISFNGKLVGINPGASFGSAKRWLTNRYAEVLDRLIKEQNAEIVIFGSSSELTIANEICQFMKYRPVILSGRTSLSHLMALISFCQLLITNDSGPMHLASALQVPTLALFGSTNEITTGPLNPLSVVLNKKVECSPCLLRECPIDHHCMTEITIEEVYQKAIKILQKTN